MVSSTEGIIESQMTLESGNGEVGALDAIILAGGHGWGDNPLERAVCRPLVPVAGKPLLLHTLEWLRGGGIQRVHICLNHEGSQVRNVLGDGSLFGMEINYYRDVMPRGPAGCVRDVTEQCDATRFLVMEGTILPQLDIRDLINSKSEGVLTVVVSHGRYMSSTGEHVLEPAGLYLFSRVALEHIPTTGYQDIKESLIPRLHVSGQRVDTLLTDARLVQSVSGLAEYLRVSHRAVEHLAAQACLEGYRRLDGAWVHQSAHVDPSARLMGPVLVEAGANIGADAIVVGPSTIGSGTRVGPGAVVSRCVLWGECVVEGAAVLDQCIAIDDAWVRAGRDLRYALVTPEGRNASQRKAKHEMRGSRLGASAQGAEGSAGNHAAPRGGLLDAGSISALAAGRTGSRAALASTAADAQ